MAGNSSFHKLAGLICKMAPQENQKQALLVDNPARLYGFDKELGAQ